MTKEENCQTDHHIHIIYIVQQNVNNLKGASYMRSEATKMSSSITIANQILIERVWLSLMHLVFDGQKCV